MVDQESPDDLRGAIELLYFAYRGFTDRPDQILAQRGLGRVHHRILYFIGRSPGLTVGDLLERLAVSKQALNAPLRRLLELELVAAQASPLDGRAKNLRLTEAGQGLEAELTGAQMLRLQAAFNRAAPADRQGWRRVMTALVEG